jgi:hypothetical protein
MELGSFDEWFWYYLSVGILLIFLEHEEPIMPE